MSSLSLKLSSEVLEKLYDQEVLDKPGLEVVEVSDWDQDYKYQTAEMIVSQKETGKFFSFTIQRSGSPFTDWNYEFYDNDGREVEKKEVIVKSMEWVAV